MANINLQQITPSTPRVLENEQITVYTPVATTSSLGVASFESEEFTVTSGHVNLKWPMSSLVELANPIERPSLTKVLSDEFLNTGNTVTITRNGKTYSNTTSEIKLNRAHRDSFVRPDLIMLDNSNNDFVRITDGEYYKYKLARNNPLAQPSLVQLSTDDFQRSNEIVSIKWPIAKDDGLGLMKIGTDGYLMYDSNGNTAVDFNALYAKIDNELDTKPTYGADAGSGFTDYSSYVDSNGIAKKENGRTLIKITKDAIGLSKVENKAFSDYIYDNFGTSMKQTFTNMFGTKLDETTWNKLFADWQAKSSSISTPYTWLEYLEAEKDSIWATISAMGVFLGTFNTPQELEEEYPASDTVKNSTAFVISTNTYWAVKKTNGAYTWYDTKKEDISFYEAMEVDPTNYKANGLIGSAGSSGKWAQSDHVHPIDETRLSKQLYQSTNLTITSTEATDNDFVVELWEKDSTGLPVTNPDTNLKINIPYVRTAQYLHNWNGDEQAFVNTNNEYYWAGTEEELNDVDLDTIPAGALLIVDDGEGVEVGNTITKDELEYKGISLELGSKDRFIITTYDKTIVGPVTIAKTNDKYYVSAIDLGNSEGKVIVTKATDGGITIGTKALNENQVLVGDASGNLISSLLNYKNIITSSSTSEETSVLTANRLLKTKTDNEVEAFDSGTIINVLLASDGQGGITTLLPSDYLGVKPGNYPLIMQLDGRVKTASISLDDVLQLNELTPNRLLVTKQSDSGKEVELFDSGDVLNKLLVADGEGGITTQSLIANRMVITDNNGILTTIAADESHSGYYYGVSEEGLPTLLRPQIIPTSLPVLTFTSNPETSQANTALVFANPNGEYRDGCLYLY